jgi:uncharacterized protein YmfQ (DUF2313 family)
VLHRDILQQLIPLEINGNFAADLAIEGHHLDEAVTRAEQLLLEMFPDTSDESIVDWERVCGIVPSSTANLQQRRDVVIQKLRAVGGLSIDYFIALAVALGYTITIDEPFATEGPHAWRITFTGYPFYDFRAGASCCGELLLDWDSQSAVEGIFQDLKPAHSRLICAYT